MKKIMPGPWLLNGLTIVGPKLEWAREVEPGAIKLSPAYIVATVEHGEDGNYRHYPRDIALAHARAIRALPQMLAALEDAHTVLLDYEGETSALGDSFRVVSAALAAARGE